MPDLSLLAIELLFAALFLVALWRALVRRSRLAADVALVFTPLAVFLGSALLESALGATVAPGMEMPPWVAYLALFLLLLQPVFSLRLVGDLRPLPRWLIPAFVLTAVVLEAAIVLETQATGLLLVAAVTLFLVGQLLAAWLLAGEARVRTGGARVRLIMAAVSTATLGFAFLILGLSGAAAASSPLLDGLVRAVALAAAGGFWIAFFPPRWLRRTWVAVAAYEYSERLMTVGPTTTVPELWDDLARTARRLTGAGIAVLVEEPGGLRVAATAGIDLGDPRPGGGGTVRAILEHDSADEVLPDLQRRSSCPYATLAPITRDGEPVGVVVLLRPNPTLFDADDEALVGRIADRSAYLVQRRAVLAEEQRLTEQLRVTVDALESASAAKSDFLASMSHELRTPLNAIIGFSELMVVEDPEADTVTVPREWVDHIRNAGAHLVSLINDVLDLAKVEAGRLELARTTLDVGHAVAESVAGLRPLADRKRQRLEVDGASIPIEADGGRLRQILYNLLSNAIKFTGEEGTIRVEAAREGNEVRISVQDTGVGISVDDQQHVFEEFRQVGDPNARVAGTGLGLALTKRLVEAHGGRIGLTSERGVGSTFTVWLPIGSPQLPGGTDGTGTNRPGGSARVLIIEDDPSSARLLHTYLTESGYEVAIAADGETGLAMVRADPPAAILLDVLLPTIDGWEVLRRLKLEPSARDIPVVIVTVVDERNVGLALGAVDYFVKPIEREALLARLARHTFLTKARERRLDIVAIDDDPAALEMIDATLAPLGFAVHRAASGQDGLHLVDAVSPDLVICDLLMPGVDGFEVVGRMQANPSTAAIPILILTSHELTAADKSRLNGRILGVVDKGDSAVAGLRSWLSRVAPELVVGNGEPTRGLPQEPAHERAG